MKDWKNTLVSPDASIEVALQTLDSAGLKIVLIADKNSKLLGVVTDGDFRRGILKGYTIKDSVQKIMNKSPITGSPGMSQMHLFEMVKSRSFSPVPLVDDKGRIVGLETFEALTQVGTKKKNWVILMAGGLGKRLFPLTNDRPKPLIHVGDRPILETIVLLMRNAGFEEFFVTTHYRADMIQEHFGDGSKLGVNIHYLHEESPLGTAGSLSLLPEVPTEPLIVMNADLLTNLNFDELLKFHTKSQADMTVCVRDHQIQVPFGVVETKDVWVKSVTEKPTERYLVNAGVYALNPRALKMAQESQYGDMVSLLNGLVKQKLSVAAFPITEYWIDIGQIPDLEKAQLEFSKHFGHMRNS